MKLKPQNPAIAQRWHSRAASRAALGLLLAIWGVADMHASSVAARNRQGNQFYRERRYQEAEKAYLDARAADPARPELLYNMGNALLRQKKYDQALQALNQAVSKGTRGLQGSAWYNLGNALFGTGKYKDAAEAYVQTLRINPADREAKQNLELALRKLQQQQKQPASGGGQNDQQQKDDKSPQKDPPAGNNANKQPDKQDKQEGPGPRPEQENQERPANPQATQSEGRAGGLSKERALQILDALQNQELADQRKSLERQARRKAIGKDW